MNENLSFIAYSHSSYSDLWIPFFDRLEKHLPISFAKYYLFVDEVPEEMREVVPDHFEIIAYQDEDSYTDRLKKCLEKVQTDYCVFHHEDMILCGDVNVGILDEYFNAMKTEEIDYIKLLKGGDPKDTVIDNRHSQVPSLCKITNDFMYIIAIQPSIWRVKTFLEIVSHHEGLNIWEFESEVHNFCRTKSYKYFYSYVGTERKRGLFHWDCAVYPAICTAIFKGKWTTTEYWPELFAIFQTYNIDPDERGSA